MTITAQDLKQRRQLCDDLEYCVLHDKELLTIVIDEFVYRLNDMFSTIADLGLFDDPSENEQDSSPDVFDKLWDKVTKL